MMFPCTNNISKYEALINGMKITIEWWVDDLKIFKNSQLVNIQLNHIYQMKDDKFIP